jgi:hypothetical protein
MKWDSRSVPNNTEQVPSPIDTKKPDKMSGFFYVVLFFVDVNVGYFVQSNFHIAHCG